MQGRSGSYWGLEPSFSFFGRMLILPWVHSYFGPSPGVWTELHKIVAAGMHGPVE